MKHLVRQYISVVLLFCMTAAIAPFSLIHTHEDDIHKDHIAKSHDDGRHVENDSYNVEGCDYADEAKVHSDVEDCDFCKIILSLNNQDYTLNNQLSAIHSVSEVKTRPEVNLSFNDNLIKSSLGRAPPVA